MRICMSDYDISFVKLLLFALKWIDIICLYFVNCKNKMCLAKSTRPNFYFEVEVTSRNFLCHLDDDVA
ncbi:hypothetical protein L1987_60293 [Smallanthus sonchifolius]|uniref:Uncharacterized protein n=1 Tax=Smallanthus sonchifolius TaxID=185202 RepID=A0ACB9D7U0_9ASTR|nr:hypothetical protein L1987_60293 [Smallanthus sonchifolius]